MTYDYIFNEDEFTQVDQQPNWPNDDFAQEDQQPNWLNDDEDFGLNSEINVEPLIDITIPFNNTNNTAIANRSSNRRAQNGTVVIHRRQHLNLWGSCFRDRYYALIKNKRRNQIIKKCIIYYHGLAQRQYELEQRQNNLSQEQKSTIKPLTRVERRNISLYFNNHACEMDIILKEISKMQDLGIINYPADYARLRNTSH